MPNAYDVALRRRAVMAYERGEGSYAQLAALFDLNPRTLERWVARWRVSYLAEPLARGGGRRSPIDLAVLHVLAREGPDATVAEMCREYNRCVRRTQGTSAASFHRALVREGFVIKKMAAKKWPRRSEIDRPDVVAQREAFVRWQRRQDPDRLVFLDEAGPIWRWAVRTCGSSAAKNTSSPAR
jgi:transposase-like protein